MACCAGRSKTHRFSPCGLAMSGPDFNAPSSEAGSVSSSVSLRDAYPHVLIIGCAVVEHGALGESEESADDSAGADYTAVSRDHVALQDFFKKRGCYIAHGTICDTDLQCGTFLDRIAQFFSSTHLGLRILAYLGNAHEESGAWCFSDGAIGLETIIAAWKARDGLPDDQLLVYSDSCYSGNLCMQAYHAGADIFVQASCGDGKDTALENVFTSTWITVHQEPERRPAILDSFERQNQQCPMYYDPRQLQPGAASDDAQPGRLVCGTLEIHLVGQSVVRDESFSEEVRQTEERSDPKPRWLDLREMLPFDLQLRVAELAERPGWRESADFERLLELMVGMHRQQARRGGAPEADLSDVLEILDEFVADKSLSPLQAYEKFQEEFG